MDYKALIAEAVDKKLAELAGIPIGSASGRRLELGLSNPAAIPDVYRRGFTDVAERLGVPFFEQIPVVALDQLIVVSVTKDHDTAGLLKSLINSFLVAYVSPETSDRAYSHLVGLESLREEVATRRRLLTTQLLDVTATQKH